MKRLTQNTGFTVVEVLIAAFLTSVVAVAAFNFYVTQHNQMIVQTDISDAQQNLRVTLDDLSFEIRNTGSNLPTDLPAITASNTNPDTLSIRFADYNSKAIVGKLCGKAANFPIEITAGTDLSAFNTGDKAFLWHTAIKGGEWFTISKMTKNDGTGWDKIYHEGANLTLNAIAGDFLVKLEEIKYFVDGTDTANYKFMKAVNDGAPNVFAENIYDFQTKFYLKNLDTVDVLSAVDTVVAIQFSLSAKTGNPDMELYDEGKDPYRRRTMSTEILLRNYMF